MKRTNIKKENREKYSGNEVKRYIGAVSEEFRGHVKVVAEQYLDIKNTLNSHTEAIGEIKGTLNSHTEMIAKVMENIEILKGDMGEVKNDLKQKVGRSEFVTLERRVRLLESKVK